MTENAGLWEESGMETLLRTYGVSDAFQSTEETGMLSAEALFQKIIDFCAGAAAWPARTAAMLAGVILMSAVASALQNGKNTAVHRIYEILCTLCAVLILSEPSSRIFFSAAERLKCSADFMLSFTAIFGAVLTVSSGAAAAVSYQGAMVLLCSVAIKICGHILLPLLEGCLALGIVDAVNPEISLSAILRFIQKAVVWVLGIFMSLFIGMLSVQSILAVSADRLGTKTTKFVIASCIPFVGGAVSDAYSSLIGSLRILRASTGVTGILAVTFLFLPVLAELFLYRLLLSAAGAVAEMFQTSALMRLFRNMESVFAAAFSTAVCFAVMFIVSTAMMLMMGDV